MMTVQELYETAVRTLSRSERLLLASRLLSNVVEQDIDDHDEWSEQDLHEFSAASMRSLDERLRREGDAGLG
jgi:hypothetical protein